MTHNTDLLAFEKLGLEDKPLFREAHALLIRSLKEPVKTTLTHYDRDLAANFFKDSESKESIPEIVYEEFVIPQIQLLLGVKDVEISDEQIAYRIINQAIRNNDYKENIFDSEMDRFIKNSIKKEQDRDKVIKSAMSEFQRNAHDISQSPTPVVNEIIPLLKEKLKECPFSKEEEVHEQVALLFVINLMKKLHGEKSEISRIFIESSAAVCFATVGEGGSKQLDKILKEKISGISPDLALVL